jgi:hypothetical protein
MTKYKRDREALSSGSYMVSFENEKRITVSEPFVRY